MIILFTVEDIRVFVLAGIGLKNAGPLPANILSPRSKVPPQQVEEGLGGVCHEMGYKL
jgi:hypothetical protein